MTASTPSDWRASHNGLSTLKRILRRVHSEREPSEIVAEPAPLVGSVIESEIRLSPPIQPMPAGEPAPSYVTEQEWEAWKHQYWRDEKLRAKNERFLSAVSVHVDRVSRLMHDRQDIASGPATDAVKIILRKLHYKSKAVLYSCKFFNQGIVVMEREYQPILWASNGHISASAFIFFNAFLQHGPSMAATLRFLWDDIPVVFEVPEKAPHKEDRRALRISS